jgi:muconolactone delta-isomerase
MSAAACSWPSVIWNASGLALPELRTKELAEEGVVEATYIAADMSGAWLVWNVESKDALEEVHKTLPLHDHVDQDVTLLADQQ